MDIQTVGVVIADDLEFLPLKTCAQPFQPESGWLNGYETLSFTAYGKRICAVKCRIGKTNAAAATAMLIAKESPDCLLNIGLSGGVRGVNRGTVFAGTTFQECDFDLTALGRARGEKPDQDYIYEANAALLEKLPSSLPIRRLKCGTGDFFLTKDAMKDEFHALFGIHTFDMETGAIASVCHSCGVPFLSIRKVSDDSEDSAAEDYRQMNALAETALAEILMGIIKQL